jgi:hypothetical protein
MSDDTLAMIAQRLDAFQKGFEAITKSISQSLVKIEKQTEDLAQNTKFIPKVVETNKAIKKAGEQFGLLIDVLTRRLDKVIGDNNY